MAKQTATRTVTIEEVLRSCEQQYHAFNLTASQRNLLSVCAQMIVHLGKRVLELEQRPDEISQAVTPTIEFTDG